MLENEIDKMLNNSDSADSHNHKRKSLGRGLGALLGEDDLDLDNVEDLSSLAPAPATANLVDIDLIKPGKFQPRTEFDQEALQPLLVRRDGIGFEIIAGERRWRASKLAGLDKVPVIEKDLSDKEVLEVALVENLLRENLSAIEEAEGLQRLIDEFSHTQEALSQIIGKSRSHIANTLRLLNLPESVQQLVKEGKLSAGHARALVGLENAETLAQQIVAKDLSVRQVEELVAKQKSGPKEAAPKKEKDSDLADIEKDLNKNLGLRIKISPSKQGGGKVVLQYASPAELDMIIDILEQKRQGEKPNLGTNQMPASEDSSATSGGKFTIKVID